MDFITVTIHLPPSCFRVEIPTDRPRLSMLKLEQHPATWQIFTDAIFYRGHGDERINLMTELHDGDKIAITRVGKPNPLKPKTEP